MSCVWVQQVQRSLVSFCVVSVLSIATAAGSSFRYAPYAPYSLPGTARPRTSVLALTVFPLPLAAGVAAPASCTNHHLETIKHRNRFKHG